jgi:hypothetical protein
MRHIHVEKIDQFEKMAGEGYPRNLIVQHKIFHDVIRGERYSWVSDFYAPTWEENIEYRVAFAFVEGLPVFEGDQLFACGQEAFAHPHVAGSNMIRAVLKCDETSVGVMSAHCSWNPPAPTPIKQPDIAYEITTTIGDASVTVRAPTADECLTLLSRLPK